MAKLTIQDLELAGKRVLMRVDFNVPLENGVVANDQRIRAALPSIRYVVDNGGRLILMSHLGRPKGERKVEMSLRPCAQVLGTLLERPVAFVDDCIGPTVTLAVEDLVNGQVLLLENLRYYKQETSNESGFANELAKLGEIYINDAFGTAHRAHASTEGITHYINQCASGFLLTKEIDYLEKVTQNPERPFVAVLGGAKISGKIDVIENLLPKVDQLIIGGGMSYTFFKAKGYAIGTSLLEKDKVELARSILEKSGDKLLLPVDCLISDDFDFEARRVGKIEEVAVDSIKANWCGLDIGQATIDAFGKVLRHAKTVVWNGPMGVFEIDQTAKGTLAVANILAQLTDSGATTVVGGGDSAAAVAKAGVAERISHVSTGGGASLEYLEGKNLPGVAALTDKKLS
jgi:phosphoglycerate kinase